MALQCSVKDEGLPSSHPWPFSFVLLISPITPSASLPTTNHFAGADTAAAARPAGGLCVKHMSHPSFFPTKVKVFEVEVYGVGLPQAQFLFLRRENSVVLITTDNPMMPL